MGSRTGKCPVFLPEARSMSDYVVMQLSAALVPPPLVLEDLAAAVRAVRGGDTQLDMVPTESMHLPLGNFGNVGLADRTALQEALTEEVARWAPLQLRVHGGSALVDTGDDSVWAHLDGDLEQLVAMGTVLPRVVQRLGFLIDRRTFRTRIRVGRITGATTLQYLERVLARLDGYTGPAWTAHHVSLLRKLTGEGDGSGGPEYRVLHELQLVGDAHATGAAGSGGGRHRADAGSDEASPADPSDAA
jgi:2'-5' RNA ligase